MNVKQIDANEKKKKLPKPERGINVQKPKRLFANRKSALDVNISQQMLPVKESKVIIWLLKSNETPADVAKYILLCTKIVNVLQIEF